MEHGNVRAARNPAEERRAKREATSHERGLGSQEPEGPQTEPSCELRTCCSTESHAGVRVQGVLGCGIDPQGGRDGRTLGPTLSLYRKKCEIQKGAGTVPKVTQKAVAQAGLDPNLIPRLLSPSPTPGPLTILQGSPPTVLLVFSLCLVNPESN